MNDFPTDFEAVVRRVFRLLFHVLSHVYHNHFREVMLLTLHAHLNCIFAHFTLFNERFKLIEEKETDVLHDLVVALKLAPRLSAASSAVASDGIEENKENIDVANGCSGLKSDAPSDKPESMDTDEVAGAGAPLVAGSGEPCQQ